MQLLLKRRDTISSCLSVLLTYNILSYVFINQNWKLTLKCLSIYLCTFQMIAKFDISVLHTLHVLSQLPYTLSKNIYFIIKYLSNTDWVMIFTHYILLYATYKISLSSNYKIISINEIDISKLQISLVESFRAYIFMHHIINYHKVKQVLCKTVWENKLRSDIFSIALSISTL